MSWTDIAGADLNGVEFQDAVWAFQSGTVVVYAGVVDRTGKGRSGIWCYRGGGWTRMAITMINMLDGSFGPADINRITLSAGSGGTCASLSQVPNGGVACYVYAEQLSGTVPLHRLFNPQTGDHFYTTSDAERDGATNRYGYVSEGDACYVYPSQADGTVPLHQLFNPQTGDHFYTTSKTERDNAIKQYGYHSEVVDLLNVFRLVSTGKDENKDRKDTKEGAKEKDNPKEGAKEIERVDMSAQHGGSPAPPVLDPGAREAFISPGERPHVDQPTAFAVELVWQPQIVDSTWVDTQGATVAARSAIPGADASADQEAFIPPSERPAVGAAAVTGPTVFETNDRGLSWTSVLPVPTQPSAMIYTGNLGAYVAVGNMLWRRSDDGSVWTSETLGAGESVTALAIDSANDDTLYLLTGSRVRRRPGSGTVWEDITGDLNTSLGLTALAVAPTKTGADPHVFVGTTIGVYRAGPLSGAMTSWSRVGTSLPDVSVASLQTT